MAQLIDDWMKGGSRSFASLSVHINYLIGNNEGVVIDIVVPVRYDEDNELIHAIIIYHIDD